MLPACAELSYRSDQLGRLLWIRDVAEVDLVVLRRRAPVDEAKRVGRQYPALHGVPQRVAQDHALAAHRVVGGGLSVEPLLVEPKARNTGENIRFSRELFADQGIDVSSVLLISKPYEERRAYATARQLWPDVEVVSASAPMTLPEYVDSLGDPRLALDMLVGAQQRLLIYSQQGFVIHQAIPEPVAEAYDRLRSEGFTSRLVPTS
ncbi:YdcF family protein [Streptomyces sp. NBC_01310]|uniref:YdcF family protein n=1 Tax=Streptomyces sp. NBC_01310 TaxID=2903820 RepID=UPI0035B66002